MRKYLYLRPIIALGVISAFLFNSIGPVSWAQEGAFYLPKPGQMIPASPAFNPPILKGLKVHPENPLKFDFILDQGDWKGTVPRFTGGLSPSGGLRQESTKLIKYFLASLTIPEKDLWVNLSPYEKSRIVPEAFGRTEMGRDLLAEDYMLKQITASLMYPEGETGKKFWKRIYEEAVKRFGTTNVPVNTFNKVWIVPDKAVVYENAKVGTAYVVESKLKVMLEEDYLSSQKHQGQPKAPQGNNQSQSIRDLGKQIIKEIIIPELTKEVNEGANFSQLRQVYNSLILATWYKRKIKDSILAAVYENQNKVFGVGYGKSVTEKIYQSYLQAFKKGAYNYIKQEPDPLTQQDVPRKYFSGGLLLQFGNGATQAMVVITNSLMINPAQISGHYLNVRMKAMPFSAAMIVFDEKTYQTASWMRKMRLKGVRMPYYFWDDENMVVHSVWEMLDTIKGFKEAREEGNIRKMAELYRTEVLEYPSKRKGRDGGQKAFFTEVGAFGGLLGKVKPYMVDENEITTAGLIRLALPGLIDLRNKDALKPWEVEGGQYWTKRKNGIAGILQALDTIDGFEAARIRDDKIEMTRLYKKEVIAYPAKKEGRENGQVAFFIEVGRLEGLLKNKYSYLPKSGSPASFLRLAIPGLINDKDPNLLHSDDVEYKAKPKRRRTDPAMKVLERLELFWSDSDSKDRIEINPLIGASVRLGYFSDDFYFSDGKEKFYPGAGVGIGVGTGSSDDRIVLSRDKSDIYIERFDARGKLRATVVWQRSKKGQWAINWKYTEELFWSHKINRMEANEVLGPMAARRGIFNETFGFEGKRENRFPWRAIHLGVIGDDSDIIMMESQEEKIEGVTLPKIVFERYDNDGKFKNKSTWMKSKEGPWVWAYDYLLPLFWQGRIHQINIAPGLGNEKVISGLFDRTFQFEHPTYKPPRNTAIGIGPGELDDDILMIRQGNALDSPIAFARLNRKGREKSRIIWGVTGKRWSPSGILQELEKFWTRSIMECDITDIIGKSSRNGRFGAKFYFKSLGGVIFRPGNRTSMGIGYLSQAAKDQGERIFIRWEKAEGEIYRAVIERRVIQSEGYSVRAASTWEEKDKQWVMVKRDVRMIPKDRTKPKKPKPAKVKKQNEDVRPLRLRNADLPSVPILDLDATLMRINQGDTAALRDLVTANLGLAREIIRPLARSVESDYFEELMSEASIALNHIIREYAHQRPDNTSLQEAIRARLPGVIRKPSLGEQGHFTDTSIATVRGSGSGELTLEDSLEDRTAPTEQQVIDLIDASRHHFDDPRLTSALSGIPMHLRNIVILHLGLDWPLEDIAKIYRRSVSTVAWELSRALFLLRNVDSEEKSIGVLRNIVRDPDHFNAQEAADRLNLISGHLGVLDGSSHLSFQVGLDIQYPWSPLGYKDPNRYKIYLRNVRLNDEGFCEFTIQYIDVKGEVQLRTFEIGRFKKKFYKGPKVNGIFVEALEIVPKEEVARKLIGTVMAGDGDSIRPSGDTILEKHFLHDVYPDGKIKLTPLEDHESYPWSILGFEEAGWKAYLIRGRKKDKNLYEFTVKFVKPGSPPFMRDFEIGRSVIKLKSLDGQQESPVFDILTSMEIGNGLFSRALFQKGDFNAEKIYEQILAIKGYPITNTGVKGAGSFRDQGYSYKPFLGPKEAGWKVSIGTVSLEDNRIRMVMVYTKRNRSPRFKRFVIDGTLTKAYGYSHVDTNGKTIPVYKLSGEEIFPKYDESNKEGLAGMIFDQTAFADSTANFFLKDLEYLLKCTFKFKANAHGDVIIDGTSQRKVVLKGAVPDQEYEMSKRWINGKGFYLTLSSKSGAVYNYDTTKSPLNPRPTEREFFPEIGQVNAAMSVKHLGGIDMGTAKAFFVQDGGQSIKFHLDPAILKQLQEAQGFIPVIIDIQPLKSVRLFLGLNEPANDNHAPAANNNQPMLLIPKTYQKTP